MAEIFNSIRKSSLFLTGPWAIAGLNIVRNTMRYKATYPSTQGSPLYVLELLVTFTFLACTMNSGHPSSAQPLANRWKDCPCFSGKSRWTVQHEPYYNIQISKLYIDNWKSPTYFTFWLWRDWTETLSLHVSSTSRSRVGWSGCNATIFPWFRCDELWSSLEWGNGGRKQTVVHGMKLQAW